MVSMKAQHMHEWNFFTKTQEQVTVIVTNYSSFRISAHLH